MCGRIVTTALVPLWLFGSFMTTPWWGRGDRREDTRRRPARTPFGSIVRALLVIVPASTRGACCLLLVGPRSCWCVGGTCDVPVEPLFPHGRKRFELASFSSGWSWVLGIDAIGGPPHCDVADEGGVWVASRRSPNWRAVTLAGVVFDLGGEVGD